MLFLKIAIIIVITFHYIHLLAVHKGQSPQFFLFVVDLFRESTYSTLPIGVDDRNSYVMGLLNRRFRLGPRTGLKSVGGEHL